MSYAALLSSKKADAATVARAFDFRVETRARRASARRGAGVAKENNVGNNVLPSDGERFAVGRKLKCADLVRGKVRQAAPRRVAERLHPYSADAILDDATL